MIIYYFVIVNLVVCVIGLAETGAVKRKSGTSMTAVSGSGTAGLESTR